MLPSFVWFSLSKFVDKFEAVQLLQDLAVWPECVSAPCRASPSLELTTLSPPPVCISEVHNHVIIGVPLQFFVLVFVVVFVSFAASHMCWDHCPVVQNVTYKCGQCCLPLVFSTDECSLGSLVLPQVLYTLFSPLVSHAGHDRALACTIHIQHHFIQRDTPQVLHVCYTLGQDILLPSHPLNIKFQYPDIF